MSKGLEALEELLYYANLNFERENECKTEFSNKIEQMGIADNEENFKIIEKDLERLEIYEKFTIPNLRNLILKLYNNEELSREEHEIIFEIMSLKK